MVLARQRLTLAERVTYTYSPPPGPSPLPANPLLPVAAGLLIRSPDGPPTYFRVRFVLSSIASLVTVGHQNFSMYSTTNRVPSSWLTYGDLAGLYMVSVRSRTRITCMPRVARALIAKER